MELGRLNASPRISILRYSRSRKVLEIDMSISVKLGPYTASAPRFPRTPNPGTANAALFKELVNEPVPIGVPRMKFGRWLATPFARLSVTSEIASGGPD